MLLRVQLPLAAPVILAGIRTAILQDSQDAFPQYYALLLVSHRAAENPRLAGGLQQLVGTISQQDVQEANRQVDARKRLARTAAEELLQKVGRHLVPAAEPLPSSVPSGVPDQA